MKYAIVPRIGSFLFAGLFFTTTAFRSPVAERPGGDTRVFIDGKEIHPQGTITLAKDDTILLEATGLKPNSEVYIKVKKAGIKWAEDVYIVDESGSVKELLDVPERNLTVNCTVTYYDGNSNFHTAEFKLRVD